MQHVSIKQSKRELCGVPMPGVWTKMMRFPNHHYPIDKADKGFWRGYLKEAIIEKGFVSEKQYLQLEKYTRMLFQEG